MYVYTDADKTLLTVGNISGILINFVGSVLTNIKTKITDYGINNALVEIYVTVVLQTDLISPVVEKENKIDYDVLIASAVINGRVPEIYGGLIQSKSNSLSIPIE